MVPYHHKLLAIHLLSIFKTAFSAWRQLCELTTIFLDWHLFWRTSSSFNLLWTSYFLDFVNMPGLRGWRFIFLNYFWRAHGPRGRFGTTIFARRNSSKAEEMSIWIPKNPFANTINPHQATNGFRLRFIISILQAILSYIFLVSTAQMITVCNCSCVINSQYCWFNTLHECLATINQVITNDTKYMIYITQFATGEFKGWACRIWKKELLLVTSLKREIPWCHPCDFGPNCNLPQSANGSNRS